MQYSWRYGELTPGNSWSDAKNIRDAGKDRRTAWLATPVLTMMAALTVSSYAAGIIILANENDIDEEENYHGGAIMAMSSGVYENPDGYPNVYDEHRRYIEELAEKYITEHTEP